MKKSKILSFIAAISILAGTLSGCGSDSDNGGAAEVPMNENYFAGVQENKSYEKVYDNAGDAADGAMPDAKPGANMAAAEDATGMQPGDLEFDEEVYNAVNIPYDDGYYNTEEYDPIVENNFKAAAEEPLSTFSIDVDTASYANARRMIEMEGFVDPNAVRIEEFINYFDYDYSEPTTDDPFSVNTELSDCPWNDEAKLLLVGLKAKDIPHEERVPTNLVFLIDVSGSMFSEDKLPLVQESFSMLTDNLTEDDRISIVTYAGEDKVVAKGLTGDKKDEIKKAINSLEAGGSTFGEAGINRAYELAEKYFIDGGNNRVILATDGDLNVGISSEEELTKLIEEKRDSGVFLSVLGFGTGNYKDNRMEALADHGNGNYSYIDSRLEAEKVLVKEMAGTLYAVAKDVKIQVEFNPENVASYRLVGYENRALANEDFADDTKDAGEIGAGHTVTALYELILNDGENSAVPPATLKYSSVNYEYESNGEYSDELLTVSLRYKQPDGDTSKLLEVPVSKEIYTEKMPSNMTFAAAAAEFAMVLRGSAYKGNADCGQILEMLENYDYRSDDYKSEFVYLVRTMDKRGY